MDELASKFSSRPLHNGRKHIESPCLIPRYSSGSSEYLWGTRKGRRRRRPVARSWPTSPAHGPSSALAAERKCIDAIVASGDGWSTPEWSRRLGVVEQGRKLPGGARRGVLP